MKTYDLSHTITPGMPVYPGTEPPVFGAACTIDAHGFEEKQLTLFSHTGTHMDAPSHILMDGKPLDRFAADRFVGSGIVVDVSRAAEGSVRTADLAGYESILPRIDFLLLYTGWSPKWGTEAYFQGYPVLTVGAARFLKTFNLSGIGVDAISVDPPRTETFPVHRILLRAGILIIENLTNLLPLVDMEFTFICPPLKIENADGSPVRALAHIG